MKILIISRSAWSDDNSFGNSFTNIFSGLKDTEIANIYCTADSPKTQIPKRFFQITEKMLVKNFLNRRNKAGHEVYQNNISAHNRLNTNEEKIYTQFKKKRFLILFWIRELIWYNTRWKSKELKTFINDFKPDLIFLPIYYSVYMNRLSLFVKKYSGKNMVGYISDDNYSLRQFSLSPFYWIDRFIQRKYIKKVINQVNILYVISGVQKTDYDRYFKKDCKILYKGGSFYEQPQNHILNKPLKIIYAGNLGAGRWQTIKDISEALVEINKNEIKALLHIYSATPLTGAMKKEISSNSNLKFHGKLPVEKIRELQKESDVCVHVESFKLKERLLVRQSFSTKIVDYFHIAHCIFAAGWKEAASIDYLIKNDAAIVATNTTEINKKLKILLNDNQLILEYGKKAWDCGKRNHQILEIQKKLHADLIEVAFNQQL